MQTFQLKSHVRACVDGASVVFLDLRRDRYWSVPLRTAPHILGLNETPGVNEQSAKRLCALDLIEPAASAQHLSFRRQRSPERKIALPSNVDLRAGDVVQVLWSCAWTSQALAARRVDRILIALDRGKARVCRPRADAADVSAAFDKVRPFYPKVRVCLFDAIALMRFMLTRGLAPTLVLGVRTAPFAAHCWLELDDKLVGDTSDHCRSFTPIAWV